MQSACAIFVACLALQFFFFQIISQTPQFRRKKIIEHNVLFGFLYKFCVKHFSFQEELKEIRSKICIGLHASGGSRVVSMQTDGRTDGRDEAHSQFSQFCKPT